MAISGPASIEEYTMTAGLLAAFLALIISAYFARNDILAVFRSMKFRRSYLVYAAAVVLVFLAAELYVVKPTQQLFFDDAIYQGMALDFIHMGQAWMCDYGTPLQCFSGEVYHEPIGTAFDLALGFLVFGVHRSVAFGIGIFLIAMSVALTFFLGFLLFKDIRAASFSGLLMALSPIVLIWAAPTTSDTHLLPYSLLAVVCTLIFMHRKTVATFTMALMSAALLTYMKVNAIPMLLVLAAIYLLLGEKSLAASLRKAAQLVHDNLLNTSALLVVLLFVLVLAPEIMYAFNESLSGDYGASGGIQQTCNNFQGDTVHGNFNLQNFEDNICANLLFWVNAYPSSGVVHPPFFTILAVVGALYMLSYDRRLLAAIGLWFLVFFLLYTAFYAGAVIYGVDWRFQLGLVAQASLLGGYASSALIRGASGAARSLSARRGLSFIDPGQMGFAAAGVLLLLCAYSVSLLLPVIGVEPWNIQQAAGARFYENMVYNSSYLVPRGCLVFSYDPTLFNINNLTSTQIGDIYQDGNYGRYHSQYQCLVFDDGYWCHTPNNLCTQIFRQYNLTPMVQMTDQNNESYGFFYINKGQ